MMLRLIGVTPEIDTKKLKKQFEPYVNGDSSVPENYSVNFRPDRLKSKRQMEMTIDELLKLLKA